MPTARCSARSGPTGCGFRAFSWKTASWPPSSRTPDVDIHIVRTGLGDVGILELDFRTEGECELAFLGLTADCTGRGVGRALMSKAVELAWARPITRMWVHTCTYDHPSALRFYMKAGFKPYAIRLEVQRDPRLSGDLPKTAAAHVPIID